MGALIAVIGLMVWVIWTLFEDWDALFGDDDDE